MVAAAVVAVADGVAAVAEAVAVAGVVAMDAAVVMASTVGPWLFAADPVAGGTPTAFASAGITDTGLSGVSTLDR